MMKKLFFIFIVLLNILFISCNDATYQEFVSEGIVTSKYHEEGKTELRYSYGLKPDGKMGYRWMPTSIPAKDDIYFKYIREDGQEVKIGYDSAYYFGKYNEGDIVKVYYTKSIYKNKKGIQKVKYSVSKIE